VAELYYKRCMALQFLDRPQEAMEAVKAADASLKARTAQLEEQLAAEAEAEGEVRALCGPSSYSYQSQAAGGAAGSRGEGRGEAVVWAGFT
jgi:hypothetical protein